MTVGFILETIEIHENNIKRKIALTQSNILLVLLLVVMVKFRI